MDLSGSVNTPLGSVKKKTGLLILAGAAVVLGIGYYRAKQQESSSAGANVGVNPATGYPYGSVDDAAALANQSAYVTPVTGGGSSGGYPSGVIANNAQWTQEVTSYMVESSIVENAQALSEALGKYITGGLVNDAQKSLIEQAIAAKGYPPVAGPSGYPPSINVAASPPTTTPTPPSTPRYASVNPGWFVDRWIMDVRAGNAGFANPDFSYERLVNWNPEVTNNIKWNPNRDKSTADNFFIRPATYRVL